MIKFLLFVIFFTGTLFADSNAGRKSFKIGKVPPEYSEYIRTPEEIDALIKQKTKNGMRAYEEDCNKGNVLCCLQAAGNYYRGVFVETNYTNARNYFTKACNLKNGTGCLYLGEMYFTGRGVKRDEQEAFKLLDYACALQEYRACVTLGYFYAKGYKKIPQDKERAKFYYRKACTWRVEIGCGYLEALE